MLDLSTICAFYYLDNIWQPKIIFFNVESLEDIKRTDKPDSVKVIPNENFYYYLGDKESKILPTMPVKY